MSNDEASRPPLPGLARQSETGRRKPAQAVTDKLFRQMVESVHGYAIFALDAEGLIASWNAGAERVKGWNAKDVLGRRYGIFHTPEAQASGQPEKELEIARSEGRFEGQGWRLRRDGSRFWADVSLSAMYEASGELSGFVKVVHDATIRRRIEDERDRLRKAEHEREQQLRTLADAVPNLVWIAEPDGSIIWYNQRWYDYTGKTPAEMQGWGWQSVHDPEMLPEVVEKWRASIESGEPFQMEFPLRGADGQFRWFLTRVSPLRDAAGNILRWFGTNTDVDEQRRVRENLREANRLKDEFLATVSHELRTPLTSILGWSQLLRTRNLDAQASDRAVEVIERNARSQARLVDDMLDVSRIITGKLRLDAGRIDPASFVEAAVDAARPAAEGKGVRLQTIVGNGLKSMVGDPARLQQVVWNLLSNAIRFTPGGGSVVVRLEEVDSHIEITVSDTGAGITPEFLPYVFDRFRQADQSTTRQHGGLGLGLAIVRHLVELHGGTVRAFSEGPGRGSAFVVRLPVARVYHGLPDEERRLPAIGISKSAERTEKLTGVTVLLADDEADTRDLLLEALTRCGAEVQAVESAGEVLEQLNASVPDVLICDIGMPGMDGYELMQRVRALPGKRGCVPAIALTAYARAGDRARAIRAGYQMHVRKPVELAELVKIITRLVRN